ncbi:hypothetical protein Q4493_15965 [Colwellia sp. 1_MG-2023]|uniref:hypothetical protein n=1 Tax=Colwellia sp. 1_MG-2023 TaxID=3062649 RepID=UPI0026E2CD82|nr:hypothetical protein [Colwellia sp. 1_MG-2023]MDO6447266.1 hypothetical protein [Colwellia sp. 1_MG-2023]
MKNSKSEGNQSSLANYMTLFFSMFLTLSIFHKAGFKYNFISDDFDLIKFIIFLGVYLVIYEFCNAFFSWLYPNIVKEKK